MAANLCGIRVCVTTIFGRGVIGYRDAIRHLVARSAWPVETITYGPDSDNVGDLRIPAAKARIQLRFSSTEASGATQQRATSSIRPPST